MKTKPLAILSAFALITASYAAPASKSKTAAADRDPRPSAVAVAIAELSVTQRTKLLALVNDGSSSDLIAVRGIGKSRADALIKARPFKTLDEVAEVKGIGKNVFSNLLTHKATASARKPTKRASSTSESKDG